MTKRIVSLVFCALILTFAGSLIATKIEDTLSSPKGALLIWSIFCISSLALLYSSHLISKCHYKFTAIGSITVILTIAFLVVLGWLANGAWYNYYFFQITSDQNTQCTSIKNLQINSYLKEE